MSASTISEASLSSFVTVDFISATSPVIPFRAKISGSDVCHPLTVISPVYDPLSAV